VYKRQIYEVLKDIGAGLDYQDSYMIYKSDTGYLVQDHFGYYIALERISKGYWNGSTIKGMELLK
jgi:hypothetical protein